MLNEQANSSPPSHLRLRSLNHISLVVSDTAASIDFWTKVCGFVPIKRPSQFEFDGAWLWRHSLAIHLIEGTPLPRPSGPINPRADHISFVADEPLEAVAARLKKLHVPFVEAKVVEDGVVVKQLFFRDPDRVTIEICNCDTLPICPLQEELSLGQSRCPSCALEVQRLIRTSVDSSTTASVRGAEKLINVDNADISPAASEFGFFSMAGINGDVEMHTSQ